MNKRFFIFLILLSGLLYAQGKNIRNNEVQQVSKRIYIETNVLPSADGYTCYISFRIPYYRLLFIKDNNKFYSKFNVSFEAKDSLTGSIVREISNNLVTANTYEETKLEDKYFQNIVKLNLLKGVYDIIPIYSNEYSGNQNYLPEIYLNLKTYNEKQFYNPIVLSGKKSLCENDSSFILANYEGNIPFSSSPYNLIIPVKDTTADKISVEIWNNDSSVYKKEIKESFLGRLALKSCGDNILCGNSSGTKTKNFIIRNFNLQLSEGSLDVVISVGNKKEKFYKAVDWFNKPFTLRNLNYAARLLRYVTDDPDVLKIRRYESSKLLKAFYEFWRKLDPTPGSNFNELLEEFYSRADYAVKEFSALNSSNGADSDRGKIYIQYGKPDNIERLYSDAKYTSEVWYYKNPDRKFVFIDKTGLGNFVLENKPL